VADLQAKTPFDGLLPVASGSLTLAEVEVGQMTSLMPRSGQEKPASAALKKAHGAAFPAPNRATGKAGCRVVWTGIGQAMLLGPKVDETLAQTCALTDQSDGWAVMELSGSGARDVLARLCPLDLRESEFKRGHTARSLIGHLNASVTRIGAERYLLLVFRSMAATAAHEIHEAMISVTAQQG